MTGRQTEWKFTTVVQVMTDRRFWIVCGPVASGGYRLAVFLACGAGIGAGVGAGYAAASGGDAGEYASGGAEIGAFVGGFYGTGATRLAGSALRWAFSNPVRGTAVALGVLGMMPEEAEAVTPAMRATVRALAGVARGAGAAERGLLATELRAMRAAGRSSGELWGLRYGVRRMWGRGYEYLGGLQYSGSQGLDAIFRKTLGSRTVYAALESKAGSGLSRLFTDVSKLRQGSAPYNLSRIQTFIGRTGGNRLAALLRTEARADRLRSFASFLRGNKLYQLPQVWDKVPALPR